MHRKGYAECTNSYIAYNIALSEDENRHTNPIKFLDSNNNILYQQPLVFNKTKYAERNDSLGNAYYKGDAANKYTHEFFKKEQD
ncbi:MAG: hypothetical protein WKF59_21345 [Chitinophagaceae bacterium]